MNKHLLLFVLALNTQYLFCAASSSAVTSDGVVALAKQLEEQCTVSSGASYAQAAIPEHLRIVFAARDGNDDLVTSLLLQNYDPHLRDDYYGATPLMFAAASGHVAVVKTLLSMTPDRTKLLTTKCKSGKCALDYAKEYKQTKTYQLLAHVHNQIEFGPLCQTHFSPNILAQVCNLIDNEQQYIAGAMYSFTHGTPARSLVKKRAAGIPITLIIDKGYQKDLCLALKYMLQNGISIGVPKVGSDNQENGGSFNMHHKFLIFYKNATNKPLLMTGSCNFTDQAFNRNWENIIITDNTESISSFIAQMSRLSAVSKPVAIEDCKSTKDTSYANYAIASRIRNCVDNL